MKAKYCYSKPHEKGLEMWFEYRGKKYSIIRSATYPESERKQHEDAQQKIDSFLNTDFNGNGGRKTGDDLADFFKMLKDDEK